MVAQVNLLPGLKQDRLSQQRTRRLIISIGLTVIVAAIAVPVLLFVYRSTQTALINRAQGSIDAKIEEIREYDDIITMLSVKQDLDELPGLYAQRVYSTQLLSVLSEATPTAVNFSNLDIGSDGSFTINGNSSSYRSVEVLFAALGRADVEFDEQRVEPDPDRTGLFMHLVLDSVGGPSGDEVTFTITGQFDISIISSLNRGNNGEENEDGNGEE